MKDLSVTELHRVIASVAVLVLVGTGGWWLLNAYPSGGVDATGVVSQKVVAFGNELRNVSLTAEEPTRSDTLKRVYGSFVTPELIDAWSTNPETALGRTVSSPWPERIELGMVSRNPDGSYTALGSVVEVGNADIGAVAIYPVALTLEDREGNWLIREATKGTYTALSERRTVIGEATCLPHKNTEGPQTMECAFGLKTEDGVFYALDLAALESLGKSTNLPMEGKISVEGTFVPVENLSSEQWSRYAIEGIIRVTAVTPL